MGFRCPACRNDFGNARDTFKEHLKSCESGRALVSAVLNMSEDDAAQHALGIARPDSVRDTQRG